MAPIIPQFRRADKARRHSRPHRVPAAPDLDGAPNIKSTTQDRPTFHQLPGLWYNRAASSVHYLDTFSGRGTMADFVHLHVHSEFSLLDGLGKVRDLTQAAAEMGMSAVALTDHGVMFGILHFYQAAKKAGIKPIVGCEIYISPRGMTQKDVKFDTRPTHLILLAEDQTGYDNLMQIATTAQLEGFY